MQNKKTPPPNKIENAKHLLNNQYKMQNHLSNAKGNRKKTPSLLTAKYKMQRYLLSAKYKMQNAKKSPHCKVKNTKHKTQDAKNIFSLQGAGDRAASGCKESKSCIRKHQLAIRTER